MLIGTTGQHIFYKNMNSIKCPHCGLTNWASDETCKRCKQSLQPAQSSYQSYSNDPYAQQAYGQQQYTQRSYSNSTYQYGHQQTSNPKQGLAITSMVLAIVSIPGMGLLIGLVMAPIAFIMGIVGVARANRRPWEYGGKGFAIAGIAVSSVAMFLFVPIFAAIVIPNLLASRKAANEHSAVASLSTIYNAERTYQSTYGKGKCGDITALNSSGLVPSTLSNLEHNGYKFSITMVADFDCEVHAVPSSMSTGNKSFMISTYEGIIHAADKKGGYAGTTDQPLEADVRYKEIKSEY